MAASGSSSSSSLARGRETGEKRERRLEDILSGEQDDDEDLSFEVEKEGSGRNRYNKQARYSPPPKPRPTLHEVMGDDNFIFAPERPSGSAKAKVPGAKGAPPSSASRNQEKKSLTGREAAGAETSKSHGTINTGRKSSATVKATRRTSLLTNGTPAYPHPQISDGDLYRHCSGGLEPQERMRHVSSWTLERSRNELKERAGGLSSKYRGPLMSALKATLRDLNRGSLHIDWQRRHKEKGRGDLDSNSSSSGKQKRLAPHPRNVANLKAQLQVVKTVDDMQRERKAWKAAEAELEAFEAETARMQGEEDVDQETLDVTSLEGDMTWSAEDRIRMEDARRALDLEREWATGSSQSEMLVRRASERIAKRQEQQATMSGTELDPRWRDVEFKADLLRSKAHSFAQLSALSQRYITAVSARGAKAIQDMTQGSMSENRSSGGRGGSSSSQANLERILSSIRAVEDEAGDYDDDLHRGQEGFGDTSEGDILRALAGLG